MVTLHAGGGSATRGVEGGVGRPVRLLLRVVLAAVLARLEPARYGDPAADQDRGDDSPSGGGGNTLPHGLLLRR